MRVSQGAATDQGMLAHFALDERYQGWARPMAFDTAPAMNLSFSDAYTLFLKMGSDEGSARMAYSHFAGGPKPWDVIPASEVADQREHIEMRHHAFWDFYHPHVVAPALRQRGDGVCSRAYEERRGAIRALGAVGSSARHARVTRRQSTLAPDIAWSDYTRAAA
jgi:hypothetical protein